VTLFDIERGQRYPDLPEDNALGHVHDISNHGLAGDSDCPADCPLEDNPMTCFAASDKPVTPRA